MGAKQEMVDLILDFARRDECIRIVTINSSRANPNAPRGASQDYDIVFIVTEMDNSLADNGYV